MARVSRPGTALLRLVVRQAIGFDGSLSRRGGGTEGGFLGGAFLIAEPGFEPDHLFLEAVNLPLLVQAVRTVMEWVQAQTDF